MQAVLFLLDAVVGFFATLFLLRFIMQWFRVSFSGQLGTFVVQLTNWAVKPLRRVIPGMGGFDWASLLPAFLLELGFAFAALGLSGALGNAESSQLLPWILMHTLRSVLRLGVYIFIAALILQAVMSWINPYSPLAGPLNAFTRPFLAPFRRLIPPIANVDLSPLVFLLILQILMFWLP